MKDWYEIDNAGEVDSPALLIYPDRVMDNILLAKKLSADVSLLRPHVKTHKMREITAMMLEAGISKFKCAAIAEAEMLAMAGAPDILLAYQPTLPKAKRLLKLALAYPHVRFSCLIDNSKTARMLSEVFEGLSLEVFIDLNAGMDRTGIRPSKAPALYKECENFSNIPVIGLHAYDGHIHDTDLAVRKQRAGKIFEHTRAVQQAIKEIKGQSLALVMGGTPTFPVHAGQPGVETSPGTFVFWDEGYRVMLPDLPFSFAALLLTRVISKIDEQTLCLDLGHKSVAAEKPLQQRIMFMDKPGVEVLGQSEEHLVIRVPDANKYEVGDAWYGVPYHICPTAALYEAAHVVRDHRYTEKWKVIARDREINF